MKYDVIVPRYSKKSFDIFTEKYQDSRLISIRNAIGFTKAANTGLSMSVAPFIVLLNDDAHPRTRGWLDKMAECFPGNIAAVGPLCDNPHQRQGPEQYPPNTGFHQIEPLPINHSWGIDIRMSFFCVMLCREAILDVGYLDEKFAPGGGEDDDWLYRAHLKGWKYGVQTDVLVSHEGQKSWEMLEPLSDRSQRAVRILKEKYAHLRVN